MTTQPVAPEGGWTGFRATNGYSGTSGIAATSGLIDILDTVEVPIVVVDGDNTIAGFNNAASELLRIGRSDLGRAIRTLDAFVGSPALEQQCLEVMADGVDARIDLRDGERWFVVRISPYQGGSGHVTGTVLTFTNVTAFRASLDQAVYERECTKVILNTVADPLVVLSADQRIQSANRGFYAMFGVTRDETGTATLNDLGNGAFELPRLRLQLQQTLWGIDEFEPVEVDDVQTASGPRTLRIDAHPLSFPGHVERRILVTFRDITEHKRAQAAKDLRSEEELRRSEAFLAEGQRLSLTGSFSWKPASDEIVWSEQLYRIYELDIGLPVTVDLIRTRVHPEDVSLVEKMKMVDQAQETGDFEWQYRLLMPDQSVKYLHAVAHATRTSDDQVEYIAVVQDVTARRLAEEALAKARSDLAKVARASSLGVLTASIAHEVNQPLSGIITNAGTCLRMLDAHPPNIDGARETARRTIRDGNRASDVITRLRALFSKEELTLEPLDLNEVIKEVLALSQGDLQRNRVTVQSELAQDLPIVSGDRIQLQQVILNLLRNASDAMGDVADRSRQAIVRTEREAVDRVRVSVSDSGVGFDSNSMTTLFDAFYTTKGDGMGMGLSVSRSIIERHRGDLWAAPNDGPGATFSFSIPTHPDSVREAVPQ
jgi:signal transduction histidine kinase